MKTTSKTLTLMLALGASALIANAQDENNPRPGGPRMQGPPPPLIHVLDANHDGTIDAAEIANASAALKTLDQNGDGTLTKEEMRPPRPEGLEGQDEQRPPRQGGQGGPGMNGQRPMGPPPPLVNALDANHDGTIDATEIANSSAALKTLDKDGDGTLTKEELRPQRPPGMGGQGGPDGQRGPRGQGGPDGQRGPRPPQGQDQ